MHKTYFLAILVVTGAICASYAACNYPVTSICATQLVTQGKPVDNHGCPGILGTCNQDKTIAAPTSSGTSGHTGLALNYCPFRCSFECLGTLYNNEWCGEYDGTNQVKFWVVDPNTPLCPSN